LKLQLVPFVCVFFFPLCLYLSFISLSLSLRGQRLLFVPTNRHQVFLLENCCADFSAKSKQGRVDSAPGDASWRHRLIGMDASSMAQPAPFGTSGRLSTPRPLRFILLLFFSVFACFTCMVAVGDVRRSSEKLAATRHPPRLLRMACPRRRSIARIRSSWWGNKRRRAASCAHQKRLDCLLL